jgi:hypothetical protein
MWEPRRLTALWASEACYRDSVTFFLTFFHDSIASKAATIYHSNSDSYVALCTYYINHRVKCSTCFCLSYIIIHHVSASLGYHQVYIPFLKCLHYHLSMPHVNTLLFLVLKSLISLMIHKIADSDTLHLDSISVLR